MATAMERAIDALSDPAVSIADALRRLLVVAHRIGAADLSGWIKQELEGYQRGSDTPDYRDGSSLPIAVRFDGYGGASSTRQLSAQELPPELGSVMVDFRLMMPLAEIAALADGSGDGDPQMQLPAFWLQRFRNLADEARVPHLPMFVANHAAIVVPRTYLLGLLDRIKTAALGLALDIESASTEAGDSAGPTVDTEPALREAVESHMTMIFASSSSVSVASGVGGGSRPTASWGSPGAARRRAFDPRRARCRRSRHRARRGRRGAGRCHTQFPRTGPVRKLCAGWGHSGERGVRRPNGIARTGLPRVRVAHLGSIGCGAKPARRHLHDDCPHPPRGN